MKVLDELGLRDEIPVASLAKQFEEVYLPGRSEPVEVPRGSEALFLLQRIRDESHRFAISYHRQLRGKRMTVSVLDDIPGLGREAQAAADQGARGCPGGEARRAGELRAFSWLPDSVAGAVYEKLHGRLSRAEERT